MFRRLSALLFALGLLGPQLSAASLEQAMKDVERLRGVTFTAGVKQRTVERADLPKLLREQIAQSLPYSTDDYVRILRTLQLVDPKTPDVLGQMLNLYQSQVLAFYDPHAHVYYAIRELPAVAQAAGSAELLQEAIAVHELTHALQDQRFQAGEREQKLRRDTDAEMAYHALVEGEASLVMTAWMLEKAGQSLDEAMKNPGTLDWLTDATIGDKFVDPDTPRYFSESLKFPYFNGMKLVVEGYKRGGWKMIDKMHANPPRSTAEILNLDAYFVRLSAPPAPAPSFDSVAENALTVEHLGEFHWRFLAGDSVRGWVDDRVIVTRGGSVLADTRWETAQRAAAFRDGYVAFLKSRSLEPRVALDGTRVRVAYGPEGTAIASFLQ
jgi:hypothetical protein